MRKLALFAAALVGSFALAGCSDAALSKWDAIGEPGRVTCYSGGELRFDDYSTGKIMNSEQSDGYYFRSATTGKLVESSGDCTIQYGVAPAEGWVATLP